MRTRIEVLVARNTVVGCCDRFADMKGCDCLKEAVSTDDGGPYCNCVWCQIQRETEMLTRQDISQMHFEGLSTSVNNGPKNLLEQCEHGRREIDCALCTMQKRGEEFDQHVEDVTRVCSDVRKMIDGAKSITVARRLELMHLSQELVRWAEAKGVKEHEIPLLKRMVELLLEAE